MTWRRRRCTSCRCTPCRKKAALLSLSDDLTRALKPRNRLLILLAHASLWQTFTRDEIHAWLRELGHWLRRRQCTLVVLSHGNGVNKLRGQLAAQHRVLDGLANLQWQQDSAQYLVNWWGTASGVNANQLLTLYAAQQGWQGKTTKNPFPAPRATTTTSIWRSSACWKARRRCPPTGSCWQTTPNWRSRAC
ncbi:hypothetical protein GGER_01300 [Serratia rubidaea]